MALLLSNIKMPLSSDISDLPQLIAEAYSVPKECVQAVRLVRQSLDARKKQDIHFVITAVVQMEPVWQARLMKRADAGVKVYEQIEEYTLPKGTDILQERIVVVGMGPAGLFAAYFLAQAGYKPLLVERGCEVEKRVADVERFWNEGLLHEESNVMFGEGGAGAFSDGKLTARSKDARADVVLKTLAAMGAPQDIAYHAKPHVGTDLLRGVVKSMREWISRMGGEVRFETTLSGLHITEGRLTAVRLTQRDGREERLACAACILAIGQAARDTYEMLHAAGVVLQPKPFAVGLRVEHPQALIDRVQFGAAAGDKRLGAAEYHLAARSGSRGVYTFCMCPGGHVIASSSGAGQVVVNGMSTRARNAENANAAVVVQVGPEDFGMDPFAGIRFQEALERQAFVAGGGGYAAPVQRVDDFLAAGKTKTFGAVLPSYRPGVQPYRLDELLPPVVAAGIRDGMRAFDQQLKGFAMPDAVFTGVESRTSAPVRIVRDERQEAVGIGGLYPVGEGAGYAGGIVSAAIDGMRAAECVAAKYAAQT